LVELLVTVAIIGLLMAMLFPAVNAARESGRQSACMNNLRQFGVGMASHASRHGTYCSGAFDWAKDGCVTEIGWVADAVDAAIPAGKMLCPSNPAKLAATYNELINMDTSSLDACVNYAGSEGQQQPDGTLVVNPCRKIIANTDGVGTPGSDERRALIEEEVLKEHYNTNYTASWFLVRGGILVNESGNLRARKAGCTVDILLPNSTGGPLLQSWVDASQVPSSFLPLLGDGRVDTQLASDIGSHKAGDPTVHSLTYGPRLKTTLEVPTFADGTTYQGESGWWKVWAKDTLQDYRAFSPVHRHQCNMLMADGSVRSFTDDNRDGYLNNGFPAGGTSGFTSAEIELAEEEVFSGWALRDKL
jgi:prepilin-type processing-associated H-X9-DG protein